MSLETVIKRSLKASHWHQLGEIFRDRDTLRRLFDCGKIQLHKGRVQVYLSSHSSCNFPLQAKRERAAIIDDVMCVYASIRNTDPSRFVWGSSQHFSTARDCYVNIAANNINGWRRFGIHKVEKITQYKGKEEETPPNNDFVCAQCWVEERDDRVQQNKATHSVWEEIHWRKNEIVIIKLGTHKSFQSPGRRSTLPNEGKRAASVGGGLRNVNVCFVKRRGQLSLMLTEQKAGAGRDVWSSVWTARAGGHVWSSSSARLHFIRCSLLQATPLLFQLFSATLHTFSPVAKTHLLNS